MLIKKTIRQVRKFHLVLIYLIFSVPNGKDNEAGRQLNRRVEITILIED